MLRKGANFRLKRMDQFVFIGVMLLGLGAYDGMERTTGENDQRETKHLRNSAKSVQRRDT